MTKDHGRREDFFQGGTTSGFSRGSQKYFRRRDQKWQKFILTTRNVEKKRFVSQTFDRKIWKSSVERPHATALPTPMRRMLLQPCPVREFKILRIQSKEEKIMRRPPFQMLYSIQLMRSWSAVWDASNAVYSFLHYRLVFSFSCVVLLWKLDVTRQDCTSQATACSKIVVK